MYNGETRKTITRRMKIAAFSERLHTDKEKGLPHPESCALCHFCICSHTLDGIWMKPLCTITPKGSNLTIIWKLLADFATEVAIDLTSKLTLQN